MCGRLEGGGGLGTSRDKLEPFEGRNIERRVWKRRGKKRRGTCVFKAAAAPRGGGTRPRPNTRDPPGGRPQGRAQPQSFGVKYAPRDAA